MEIHLVNIKKKKRLLMVKLKIILLGTQTDCWCQLDHEILIFHLMWNSSEIQGSE